MRPVAIIEMELLSETIFGGDSELFGTADVELQIDEQGFPYFSGRTLKGVLREEAEWYNQHLPRHERLDAELVRLFGKCDEDNRDSLRFGDAKCSDALYDLVKQKQIVAPEVTLALTEVRSMTRIDETGKAATGSLRQVRVMKPGYILYAPLFINRDLTKKEKTLLETSVKLVRHVGLMRHRGKGEVRCRLRWLDVPAPVTSRTSERELARYYELTIHVHEPLKISQVLGTSDSSQTVTYIPGSVLRGALIHEFLHSIGEQPERLETEIVLNPQHVQFWNGYLAVEQKRSLPFALHLFEPKDQAKMSKQLRDIYDSLDEQQIYAIQRLSPVRVSRDVMLLQPGEELVASKVRTTSALHVSVNGSANRSRNEKINVYRYEAIAPGQTFKAVVYVSGAHRFARWLSEQTELTLWLGGARNSGYGRTTVRVEPLEQSPEQPNLAELQQARQLYVLATSDWLIRDEHGRFVSSLDAKWLGRQLGVELVWKEQMIATRMSTGYVSLWRAYQPSVQTVQAGSVFRYEIQSGTLDADKLIRLMERGVGERINEGYGRLIFLTHWPYKRLRDAAVTREDVRAIVRGQPGADDRQLAMLKRNLLQQRLLELTQERVAKWLTQVEKTAKDVSLNNAKWGKLLQIASDMLALALNLNRTESPQERWDRFWKEEQNRMGNKRKLSYDGVRIGKLMLDDFIRQALDYRYSFPEQDDWMNHEENIDHLYWNVRALELFFRQIIRRRTAAKQGRDAV